MQMVFMLRRLRAAFVALDAYLARWRLLLGAAVAVLLAGGFALMSVYAGPIYNLNDIGTFRARLLFIAMTAAVYLLLLTAALNKGNIYRMLLRQMIVTAGLLILLMGINQKTFFYVENTQPLIRAMDSQGLAALAGWETNLSAPEATMLYLITRGLVYDMYLVKLVCIGGYLLLCLLTLFAADRLNIGLRSEALLALCVILPLGFISAGCTALLDTVCVALLAVSLALALDKKDCRAMKWTAAVLFGLAIAVSGLALYALPVFAYLVYRRRMTGGQLALSLAIPVLACVPAIAAGMPAGEAVRSLFDANLALPEYAAGAPGFMSLIPRAEVGEMPIDMWMRYLPEIDAVTNAQPYYTQAHFERAALGLAIAGVAVYGGVCAWLYRNEEMTGTAKAFALILTALIVCPGATSAAWIPAGLMGLYAIFAEKRLRLPACMVLFASSCAAVYPMTEEVLLPMATAFALCLCALLMVMGIIPTGLGTKGSES